MSAVTDLDCAEWLNQEQVAELTDTKATSWKAQVKHLREMGLPFVLSFAGRPLVSRCVALAKEGQRKPSRSKGPNYEAIRHGSQTRT